MAKFLSRFPQPLLRGAMLVLALADASFLQPPHPAMADTTYVRIIGFDFEPRDITAPPGTTVVFTSPVGGQHTTTSVTGLWNSGVLLIADRFTVDFADEGTYLYVCNIHSDMRGSITVTANAPLPPEPAWVRETPVVSSDRSTAPTSATAPTAAVSSSAGPETERETEKSGFLTLGVIAVATGVTLLIVLQVFRRRRS